MPIIDDMLENRKRGVEQINSMFGTNISVRKSSAWKIKQEETDITLEAQEAEIHNQDESDADTDSSLQNGADEDDDTKSE